MSALLTDIPKTTIEELKEVPASYSRGRTAYPISYRAIGVLSNASVAESAIEKYFHRYDPAGYGTRIEIQHQNRDGTVTVEIRRRASCE
jgi:hypothetical protein